MSESAIGDLTIMQFGKYKGLPMQDIPASYFNYLWHNGVKSNVTNPLRAYIMKSMDAFKLEDPDLIW